MFFLGIDTSCYTTSVALIDEAGRLMGDQRIVLPVPQGGQGLQQSQAFYYHVQNLPQLVKQCFSWHGAEDLRAVAVSTKPRPIENSYMPVFKAGLAFAQVIAALFNVPLIETSHQEGHIAAGLWSVKSPQLKQFLTVHLSGGTTEILQVEQSKACQAGFHIETLAGTTDISAGQFIDRIGVALGLPFPAGSSLEKLAAQGSPQQEVVLPIAVKGMDMSFSGPLTKAETYLRQGLERETIARAVEVCIAKTLEKAIGQAVHETGQNTVLMVGGVSANRVIRTHLSQALEQPLGLKLYYPEPEYCTDNAVGMSLLAQHACL